MAEKIFKNTYITGRGRRNYLSLDKKYLEDPLFTSFTFDIDYIASPLFYTINSDYYGYPEKEGLANNIETALKNMYGTHMKPGEDNGYDILPVMSANKLGDTKLGFGLQQNVYMDLPLYGATEYIYMVDKRNGGSDQNDVRNSGSNGTPNLDNSLKLGDSVKSIVNESDKKWAERKMKQNSQIMDECDKIIGTEENPTKERIEHDKNVEAANDALKACSNISVSIKIDGVDKDLTEGELQAKINELKTLHNEFELFKREVIDWANGILTGFQNRITKIYNSNECIKKIASYDSVDDNNKESIARELEKKFESDFRQKYIFIDEGSYWYEIMRINIEIYTIDDSFLAGSHFVSDMIPKDEDVSIRDTHIIKRFKDKLIHFGLYDETSNTLSGGVKVLVHEKEIPEWVYTLNDYNCYFFASGSFDAIRYIPECLMSYQCSDDSFEEFETSKKISSNEELLNEYETALEDIREKLYGLDANGNPSDMSNPSPDSPYGQYLAALEKCENDDFSQAQKACDIAKSGYNELNNMISDYDESNNESSEGEGNVPVDTQTGDNIPSPQIIAPQTVLDMLGFISGMKKMTNDYPYIIQGITGLDTAYNKHYGIKDPYLGSGEDKITLTCLESIDLRVSSMFNRYFNAVYDRQYRRERVPINLRRFNCSVYVHDVRHFVTNNRETDNRILELTDMYYSAVEFRFYDCEIVPEETGNIFNDVSNEAPSEMKKTNFTFTYGNCVVNFIPNNIVSENKNVEKKSSVSENRTAETNIELYKA